MASQGSTQAGNIDRSKHHFSDVAAIGSTFAKLKRKRGGKKKKLSLFERRYSKLALNETLIPERKRIDYVLVYPNTKSKDTKEMNKRTELKRHETDRARFERLMENEGFNVQSDIIGEHVYVKIHCPFKRLCVEAERVKIEMPLKNCEIPDGPPGNIFQRFAYKHLENESEIVDFVSAQFIMDKIHLYEGHEDPTNFFRPSLRSLLTYHILINLDIRTVKEMESDLVESDNENEDTSCSCCPAFCKQLCCCLSEIPSSKDPDSGQNASLKKKGLRYLLMKKSYTDAFLLHEDSAKAREKEDTGGEYYMNSDAKIVPIEEDPRRVLDEKWSKFFKFQPLWHIRNYFGEKISFYFAWTGMLITTLWIPMIFGIIIFFYGLYESITENASYSNATSISQTFKDVLGDVKKAFDNDATPYFALFICCWGTIFLEMWKRECASLAYEWDVDQFEANEPDRPQFYGTKVKEDPVTNENIWFYPLRRQLLKVTTSGSILILMMFMVIASVIGVIAYRVILSVDYCPNVADQECFLVTTLVSSILNAASILLLGKIYDKLAVVLTDWENHRTQTRYDDALIIKLFAFQFVNSYASCFYIAFFRGRFELFEDKYTDSCEGSCMTQLSFQVLVLMFVKPIPRFSKDIIIPFLQKLWRKRPKCCRCGCCPCCKKNQVSEENKDSGTDSTHSNHTTFLERERQKPDLEDFTLGEYTEKVILYGFLMLFASSFPLAPLLALGICYIDIKIDAKRMLWWYRRPVAFISEDIGMWYNILNLVNIIGVITNAFIIAFTSNWGTQFDTSGKLWVVIGFEHIVFALKLLLAYLIPDVPQPISLAIRREKFLVMKKFQTGKSETDGSDYSCLFPSGISINETVEEEDEDEEVKEGSVQVSQPVGGVKVKKKVKRKRPSSVTWEHDATGCISTGELPPIPPESILYGTVAHTEEEKRKSEDEETKC